MARRNPRKPRPPLTGDSLSELALAYVGRFATTRAKLAAYLRRKLAERGWSGERPADVEALVDRFAANGYVDDSAYALAKSRSLSARGYGARRITQSLRAAGVDEADGDAARQLAEDEAVDAAIRFARRRHLGPFAEARPDRHGREKAIAAMIRAGHGFSLARAIVDLAPGEPLDSESFSTDGQR